MLEYLPQQQYESFTYTPVSSCDITISHQEAENFTYADTEIRPLMHGGEVIGMFAARNIALGRRGRLVFQALGVSETPEGPLSVLAFGYKRGHIRRLIDKVLQKEEGIDVRLEGFASLSD